MLTQGRKCDLAAPIFDLFAPQFVGLEVRAADRLLESTQNLVSFLRSKVFRINLFPSRGVVLVGLCSAGWKQRQICQGFVMRKVGEQLFFELRPIPSGDHRYSDDQEQIMQQS